VSQLRIARCQGCSPAPPLTRARPRPRAQHGACGVAEHAARVAQRAAQRL